MDKPLDLTWERLGKTYHFQEYPETREVRICVLDNDGYPCYEQVVLPEAIWNAMAYMFVARDQKPISIKLHNGLMSYGER